MLRVPPLGGRTTEPEPQPQPQPIFRQQSGHKNAVPIVDHFVRFHGHPSEVEPRELIDRAAGLPRKNRSDFMLDGLHGPNPGRERLMAVEVPCSTGAT